MKGKKLIFAVILSLIVCLVLIPTCAYASEIPGDTPLQEESDLQPQNQQQGNLDEGNLDEGNLDEGNLDEGKTDEGATNEGNLDEGKTDEGNTDEGKTDEGNLDEDKTNEGATDEGKTDEGSTDEGSTDEGSTDEGSTDEGSTDEGSTDEGNTDEGQSPEILQPTKKPSSFTVEFSYGDKTCKLEDLYGNEQFGLTEILKELGIEGNIDDAKGDADDLFAAENGEDGWKVITKQAFGSRQTLTVTVGGVEYVLAVIDDQEAGTIGELKNAIDKTSTPGDDDWHEINITGNITGNIVVDRGQHIVINLGGYTLTNTDADKHTITVKKGGKLILNGEGTVDNTMHKGAALYIEEGGYAEVNEGVTLKRSNEAGVSNGADDSNNGNSYYTVDNRGTLYIYAGTIENNGSFSACVHNGYYNSGDYNTDTSEAYLCIDGGTIKGGKIAVKNDDLGVLEINGGSFTNNDSSNSSVIQNWNTAVINGGTFEAGNNGYVIRNAGCNDAAVGTLTINGGTFINNNAKGTIFTQFDDLKAADKTEFKFNIGDKSTSVIINGGTFNGKFDGTSNFLPLQTYGGVYSNDTYKLIVNEEYSIISKSGDYYAVNFSAAEIAKPGETLEIINLPGNLVIDENVQLPAGVTIVNNTEYSLTLNGITIKAGESYTIPYPPTATTGEVLFAKYYVVDGKGQEWTKGSADGLKFELNSDKVVKVLIDGVEVEFTVENGEIVIAAEVLEALEAGEHEIEFVFDDGSCKTEFIIK